MLARNMFSLVPALTLAMSASVTAATIRPAAGPVVLARSSGTATYLWSATAYVTQLVNDKDLGESGLRDLEATALTILAEKARSAKSTDVMLRVVYERTGAVSPVYGSATFAGVEDVFTMEAERSLLLAHGAQYALEAAAGRMPTSVHLSITGELPSR